MGEIDKDNLEIQLEANESALEAEELKRDEEYNKKRARSLKIALITFGILCLISFIIFISTTYIVPKVMYATALTKIQNEEYDSAIPILQNLQTNNSDDIPESLNDAITLLLSAILIWQDNFEQSDFPLKRQDLYNEDMIL